LRARALSVTGASLPFSAPRGGATGQAGNTAAPRATTATTLLNESIGDGRSNCLEQAYAACGPNDTVTLLSDRRDPTGHAVVERADGTVFDPASQQSYASMEAYLAANPQYALRSEPEARNISRASLARVFSTEPSSPQRALALAAAGLSNIAQVSVADDEVTTATYPPEVVAALSGPPVSGDINGYLASLTPPADVAALGVDAVNAWKIEQLAGVLHEQIYAADGSYLADPAFNDAQAIETIYAASAQLTYDTLIAEGKDPYGADHAEWLADWSEVAGGGIGSGPFGDYGWYEGYQDGTTTQSSHFHMALHGALVATLFSSNTTATTSFGEFVAHLGNMEHELRGAGPSMQDAMNSMAGIEIARQLSNGTLNPFTAANAIGAELQTGAFCRSEVGNPINLATKYAWIGFLPVAPTRTDYPD
jgi:hypothetical protein